MLITNYLKTIAQDLGLLSPENSSANASSHELTFLKWLISHQYPEFIHHSYNKELQNQMIKSCTECRGFEISGKNYEDAIYNYALNYLPTHIRRKRASEHDILLYAYAALTENSHTGSRKYNGILRSIINSSKKNIEPYLVPHKDGRKDEDLIETAYGQLPAFFNGMDFVERIIFIFYLWLADISTKEHYDKEVSAFVYTSNTYEEPTVNISDTDINTLWETCTQALSRYSYYYCQEEKKTNYSKLQYVFHNYIGAIPEKHFSFVPSLITLYFNNIEPKKSSTDKTYADIGIPSNDLPFLKMLLLEPIIPSSHGKKDIDKRFEDEISMLNDCHFNDTLEEYINSLDDHDKEIAQHLFSSCGHDFYFTYSYFEIFLYVYEHRSMFITNKKMDFTLSILHLNAVTHWFDAFMLMNDMPFDFRNYDFLYLKLLSIYPTFQPIIKCLSNITFSTSDGKVSIGYNGQTIKLENFLLEFYEKADKRLTLSRLLDIAKERYVDDSKTKKSLYSALRNSSRRIPLNDINPIYKWIYLCEHDDISEERLEQICYSGYHDFLQKKADSTSWRTPILVPDPFLDDVDVFDSNNFF